MDFWLLDVKSTVIVNGKEVAFDYINTYYTEKIAVKMAKKLAQNENVLQISVHHWILKEDGTQEHADNNDKTDVPFFFLNKNHRELTKK